MRFNDKSLVGVFDFNKTPVITVCCSTNNMRDRNKQIISHLENELDEYAVILSPEFINVNKLKDPDGIITNNLEKLGFQRILMSDIILFIPKDDGSYGESTTKEINYVSEINKPYIELVSDDNDDITLELERLIDYIKLNITCWDYIIRRIKND